jgi:hypothetical protein
VLLALFVYVSGGEIQATTKRGMKGKLFDDENSFKLC